MTNTYFDNYLADQFMKEYVGDKDHAEAAYESWLEKLDISDIIEFGNDAVVAAVGRAEIESELGIANIGAKMTLIVGGAKSADYQNQLKNARRWFMELITEAEQLLKEKSL